MLKAATQRLGSGSRTVAPAISRLPSARAFSVKRPVAGPAANVTGAQRPGFGLGTLVLRPELTVARTDTPAEQAAARTAERVAAARPVASVKAAGGRAAPPIVHEVLATPGRPLDIATRTFFEPRFGRDLSDVRIHTGGKAAASARAINAHAYTVGRDVVFRDGEYAPASGPGRGLLAHELAHVVQADGRPGQVVHRQAAADENPDPVAVPADTPQPAVAADTPAPDNAPAPASSGPGPSGGKPDASVPDCTAVMGGRPVDYWAAKIVNAYHTFMNFKLDASNYLLIEAGPTGPDNKVTGAWVKPNDWDTRGPRVTKTFAKDDCARIKDSMVDATNRYHAAGVRYDPTGGPNSNSFMEQLTFTCKDLPKSFQDNDVAWDYWDKPDARGRIHSRPI